MGMPCCDVCEEALAWDGPHVCEPQKIMALTERLRNEARQATARADRVQNAVIMTLKDIPVDDSLSLSWLRKIWKAAECQEMDTDNPDTFLHRWLSQQRVLCEAFDVFRMKKYGHFQDLLQKLTDLRAACDEARVDLGYDKEGSSGFDMTPEELVAGANE